MKYAAKFLVMLCAAGVLLGACSSKNSRQQPAKKLYITPEDYQEDMINSNELERREAQPNYESDYVFNAYPQADPNIYFFDKRQQPKVPGVFSDKDYKNEKRLWTKPKRYSPDEYYGMQGDSSASAASAEESGYYEQADY